MNYYSNDTVGEVDSLLDGMLKFADRDFKAYLKEYFQNNIQYLLDKKIELKLVVDTCTIISELRSYAKIGKSFLMNLIKSPFLKLYSPPTLLKEIKEKIPKIAKETGKSEDSIIEVFQNHFLPKIEISETYGEAYWRKANEIIGNRDEKDIPFVALHLSIESHGIITQDKDILDQPEIKTWKRPGIAGKVITKFEKGSLSFFIASKSLQFGFRLLMEIATVVIRTVWIIIRTIIEFATNLISSTIKAISKLPMWAQIILGISGVCLLAYEKTRNEIIKIIKASYKMLHNFLVTIYNYIKNIIEILSPLLGISVKVFHSLFDNVQETINTLKSL